MTTMIRSISTPSTTTLLLKRQKQCSLLHRRPLLRGCKTQQQPVQRQQQRSLSSSLLLFDGSPSTSSMNNHHTHAHYPIGTNRQLPQKHRRGEAAVTKYPFSTKTSASKTGKSNVDAATAKDKDGAKASASSPLSLYMWGTDTKGCLLKPLERKDETMLDVPTKVVADETSMPMSEILSNIRKVVCGPTDTAILTNDNNCYVFGENKYGQLGLGHKDPVTIPTPITLPDNNKISDIALSHNFACLIDEDEHDLYTTGFGGSTIQGMGCLGHGDMEEKLVWTRVDSLVEDGCLVQEVGVGELHTTVLTTEGEALTCGAGSYGRLGNFETIDQLYLEPVELLTTQTGIIQIATGKSFTLALSKEGVIYGWGRNHKGQLGTGLGLAVDMYAMQAVPEPIETDELLNRKVIRVAAGHSHAAAITESGELFFWGMQSHLEPVRIDTLLHTKIVDVQCGEDYTFAIDENGQMYSWGIGKTGVLGQGGSIRRLNQPTIMEAFSDKNQKIVQASAGWKHAACLVQEEEKQ